MNGLRNELGSACQKTLEALLWMDYTSADPKESDSQLLRAQVELRALLTLHPSLRNVLPVTIESAYGVAQQHVAEDYGVVLPDRCPYSQERILEDPIERLASQGRLS